MSTITLRVLGICSLMSAVILVWILGVALQTSPETTAAATAHCLDRAALAKFQLARTVDDLVAVLGPADSPCRPLASRALEATQRADFQGLIPAYTVFFTTAAVALAGVRRVWTLVAIVATLVAAAANLIEDRIQLMIIQSVEQAGPLLPPLEIATLAKFLALAVCAAAFAGWALDQEGKKWPLPVAGLLPLPATLVSAADPQRLGFLMTLTFLLFAVVLCAFVVLVTLHPHLPRTPTQTERPVLPG
jgi:hypothetical protein